MEELSQPLRYRSPPCVQAPWSSGDAFSVRRSGRPDYCETPGWRVALDTLRSLRFRNVPGMKTPPLLDALTPGQVVRMHSRWHPGDMVEPPFRTDTTTRVKLSLLDDNAQGGALSSFREHGLGVRIVEVLPWHPPFERAPGVLWLRNLHAENTGPTRLTILNGDCVAHKHRQGDGELMRASSNGGWGSS